MLFSSSPSIIPNIKALALIPFEMFCKICFNVISLRRNNSKMGDNSDEKIIQVTCFFFFFFFFFFLLFFFSRGIQVWNFKTLAYMVLKLCYALESVTNELTNVTNNERTNRQARSPMPMKRLGHKKQTDQI